MIGPFEVLEYLLRIMSPYLDKQNIELTFVLLPYLEQFGENNAGWGYKPEKEVFRMLEIPYIDLTDDFRKNDFYPIDRHLTPKGQEKLGHLIAQVVRRDNP